MHAFLGQHTATLLVAAAPCKPLLDNPCITPWNRHMKPSKFCTHCIFMPTSTGVLAAHACIGHPQLWQTNAPRSGSAPYSQGGNWHCLQARLSMQQQHTTSVNEPANWHQLLVVNKLAKAVTTSGTALSQLAPSPPASMCHSETAR